MRVLCAIDESKFSEGVVQAFMAQGKPKETEVKILHVIEPIGIYPDG